VNSTGSWSAAFRGVSWLHGSMATSRCRESCGSARGKSCQRTEVPARRAQRPPLCQTTFPGVRPKGNQAKSSLPVVHFSRVEGLELCGNHAQATAVRQNEPARAVHTRCISSQLPTTRARLPFVIPLGDGFRLPAHVCLVCQLKSESYHSAFRLLGLSIQIKPYQAKKLSRIQPNNTF
jgi:hypothetical protein